MGDVKREVAVRLNRCGAGYALGAAVMSAVSAGTCDDEMDQTIHLDEFEQNLVIALGGGVVDETSDGGTADGDEVEPEKPKRKYRRRKPKAAEVPTDEVLPAAKRGERRCVNCGESKRWQLFPKKGRVCK